MCICIDELPTRYGGTRHHDPYSAHDVCHPHCQYLKLNSCACHNVLNIQVPSNKTFKLDLYNKGNTIDVAVLESASPVGDGEYAIDNTKRDKSAIFSESLVPGQFVVEGLTCAGFLSHKAKVNGTLECVTVTVEALDPDDGSASTNRTLHVYISNPSTAYMSSAKHCIYAYSIQ